MLWRECVIQHMFQCSSKPECTYPLRWLYMERVRVDYDAATLNEVSAKNAVQTVEAVLKVIKEGG